MNNLVWIEISKNALASNIKSIRRLVGKKVLVAPCVKANAYGHGLVETSRLFLKAGADWLCVNSIDETATLRHARIKKPILIIGYVQKNDLKSVLRLDTRLFIYDLERAGILSRMGKAAKKKIRVHLKIDTGMGRQGIMPEEVINFCKKLKTMPGIIVEGVATHFANSSDPKDSYFEKQLKIFEHAVMEVKKIIGDNLIVHADKSGPTIAHPESHFDLVRPGLISYGYYPSPVMEKICEQKKINLLPSLTLKTKVAHIRIIPKGRYIGYGLTFKTKKKTKIALLPIGYYDGFDRKMSNTGKVLIHGQFAPIIGRVCMDMCIADATNIKNIKAEDEVVVIGRQGKNKIRVEQIADWVGTINYEITTRLRESIERKYI